MKYPWFGACPYCGDWMAFGLHSRNVLLTLLMVAMGVLACLVLFLTQALVG